MKKVLVSLILFVDLSFSIAQSVGIGTTTPDSSAILELSSTTKGFLMPRMTTAQRDAIVNPVEGLQIFNTDDSCTDTYIGQSWSKNCTMKDNGTYNLPANSWRPRADFEGVARFGAVGFSIGLNGYIGTGLGISPDTNLLLKDFWEYDPNSNSWSQKADFGGEARYGAVGFSIGSKGYIGTGNDTLYYKKDFWEYDPNSNSWTQKADFGGEARHGAVGFSTDTIRGFIGTGQAYFQKKKDFWVYNSNLNSWYPVRDFWFNKVNAVGFSIGSKGYIGTGYDNANYQKKDFYEYDPSTNTWTQKADFGGTPRSHAVGFSIGTKGYIATGSSENDLWEYDPINDDWIKRADFEGVARYSAVGFSIGTKGYIGTGVYGNYMQDFWEYSTVPIIGKEYAVALPLDATKNKGHEWTSEANELYTSLNNVKVKIRGNLGITNILEFKPDVNKEPNAGKIGYKAFSSNSLDIIGAGTSYPNRYVKIFDKLYFDNISDNKKIVLFENSGNSYFGLGINSYTLRYNVPSNVDRHAFYSGDNLSLAISGTTNGSSHSGKIQFGNSIENRKIVLWENDASNPINFYGLGINASKIRYQVPLGNYHSFYIDNTITAESQPNGNFWIAGSYTSASDRKLKKEISALKFDFTQLSKINTYQYRWIDSTKDQRTQTGFIAQEIAELFPNLVTKNSEGTLGVNYIGLVPYLLEGVKLLKKENEELTLRLESVQEKNKDLKMKNEKLEKSFEDFKAMMLSEIKLMKDKK